jgi:hypothetical protein
MKSPKIAYVRAALFAGIAAPGIFCATPIVAQNADEAASNGDEIIVTARRR